MATYEKPTPVGVEISPGEIRYVCKAPGCDKNLTYNTMRLHMSENPAHKQYGFKAVVPDRFVKQQRVETDNNEDEDEPTVVESRTETTTKPPTLAPIEPVPLAKTAPEPTMFSTPKGFKLPVSLYQYYDIIKTEYSGDFSDFIAEAAIDGIIAALRSYCEECGAKIDKCPHCGAELPQVELAMVVQK